jgi:hypothetical protein
MIHVPSPFWSVYFGDKVKLFAQASKSLSFSFKLLVMTGMTGFCHHVQSLSAEIESSKLFLLGLAGNCDPPHLSLPSSLYYSCKAQGPGFTFS